MAGDLAAKQSRADELREELRVLRIQRTVDTTEADAAAHEAKLDDEIVQLENQVAIARRQAEVGGSVTEAMDAMALAAKLEEEDAASPEVVTAPVVVAPEGTVEVDGTTDETVDVPSGETEATEPKTDATSAQPIMGLVNPGGNV